MPRKNRRPRRIEPNLKEQCEKVLGRTSEFRQIYKQCEGIFVIVDGSNRLLEQSVLYDGKMNRSKKKTWKKLLYHMQLAQTNIYIR